MGKFNTLYKRIASFKNIIDENRAYLFAINGYYLIQKKNFITKCIFCENELGFWEETDDIVMEHKTRNRKCIIYNLIYKKYRKQTLLSKYNISTANKLLKKDYFYYNIDGGENNIFCYKCGFRTTEENIIHQCKPEKDFFISIMLRKNIILTKTFDFSKIKYLKAFLPENNKLILKENLKNALFSMIGYIKEKMEDDRNMILDEIDDFYK